MGKIQFHYPVTILIVALGAVLLISMSCQHDDPSVAGGNPRLQQSELTLEDVYGPHNPYHIGGVGGLQTHEEWFLKLERTTFRIMPLRRSLDFFYALHNRFPESWDELDNAGYFPIRPLDPIDLTPVNYNTTPVGEDDVKHLMAFASTEQWNITGRHYEWPEHVWVDHTWEVTPPEAKKLMTIQQLRADYPNESAMKGAMIANAISLVLWDYELRYNLMPTSADEMLDLHYVHHNYMQHDPAIVPGTPGTLVAGITPSLQIAVFAWYDLEGNYYYDAMFWDPWPTGWTEPPTDYSGINGLPYPRDLEEGTMPEIILWKCSLY